MGASKKGALAGKWTIYFLDEAGANLVPLTGNTWGLKGQTPTLRHNFGTRHKVSFISAVGTNGKLHFQTKLYEAFKGPDVVRFLKHLLRHTKGIVVVFLDGAQQHKAKVVKDFVAQHKDRIRLEFLPPYGFEYNPDEGVWAVKWNRFRNFAPRDTIELLKAYERELRNMQRRKGLVRSVFLQSKLPRSDVLALLK